MGTVTLNTAIEETTRTSKLFAPETDRLFRCFDEDKSEFDDATEWLPEEEAELVAG